eukprot:TRINITY_DN13050_c0_g2_i1.p1 TRINITY_DN13050_c0_g2~~TRINITY_DN13050_c0_g2_i1.p1  ORF type:complete len:1256 (-),score=249.18 TRINITY_DN13050_c0_g2_i1:25-3246(-)
MALQSRSPLESADRPPAPVWPHSASKDDYLSVLACNDTVVRTFGTVLELRQGCDPFVAPTIAYPYEVEGRFHTPALHKLELARVEAARLLLREENRSGNLTGEGKHMFSAESAIGASNHFARPELPPAVPARLLPEAALRRLRPSVLRRSTCSPAPQSPVSELRSKSSTADVQSRQCPGEPTSRRKMSVLAGYGRCISSDRSTLSHDATRLDSVPASCRDSMMSNMSEHADLPHSMNLEIGLGDIASENGEQASGGSHSHSTPSPRSSHKLQSSAPVSKRFQAAGRRFTQVSSMKKAEVTPEELSPEELLVERQKTEAAVRRNEQRLRRRDKAMVIFSRLKDNDETVHSDDLPNILELAGIGRPSKAALTNVLKDVTQYTTLAITEFTNFLESFENAQRAEYTDWFRKFDSDDSGTLSREELSKLIESLELDLLAHVVEEVISEIGVGKRELSLEDFFEVMHLMKVREGFTRAEYMRLEKTYDVFDRDGCGEVDIHAMRALLTYVGCAHGKAVLQKMIQQVDIDGSGSISKPEFIIVMRKLRDWELATLKQLMKAASPLDEDHISREKLQRLLASAGYFPEEDVVQELNEELGIGDAAKYTLSSLWQFLTLYREREGLSNSDLKGLSEAFEAFSDDPQGEIDASKVGQLLRLVGYCLPFEEVQSQISHVDVNKSGSLSIIELRKLVRLNRDQELVSIQNMFDKCSGGRDCLTLQGAEAAFRQLGCVDLEGVTPAMQDVTKNSLKKALFFSRASRKQTNMSFLNKREFICLARKQCAENRHELRGNLGFSRVELDALKASFEGFDQDKDGDISRKEVIILIEAVIPKLAHDARLRPRLRRIMEEIDLNGDRSLDFVEFSRLMRMCKDEEDKLRYDKAQEFRELFISAAGGNTCSYLDFDQLKELVRTVLPLGDKHAYLLERMVYEMTAAVDDGNSELRQSIDFPEFIQLMHKLATENFGNVQDSIAYLAAAAAAKTKTKGPSKKHAALAGKMAPRNAITPMGGFVGRRMTLPADPETELVAVQEDEEFDGDEETRTPVKSTKNLEAPLHPKARLSRDRQLRRVFTSPAVEDHSA